MAGVGLYLSQNQLSGKIHRVFSSFSAMKILSFFFFSITVSVSSFKSLLEKSQEILPTCTQIRHLDKQIQLPFKICLIEVISVYELSLYLII